MFIIVQKLKLSIWVSPPIRANTYRIYNLTGQIRLIHILCEPENGQLSLQIRGLRFCRANPLFLNIDKAILHGVSITTC